MDPGYGISSKHDLSSFNRPTTIINPKVGKLKKRAMFSFHSGYMAGNVYMKGTKAKRNASV